MKILVPIVCYANSGREQEIRRRHLHRIVGEYRSMPFAIDMIVFSNRTMTLPRDVEIVLAEADGHPFAFPYVTRPFIRSRFADYDLILYTEDDILVTERNVRMFLDCVPHLPEKTVPGFIRFEVHDGSIFYPDTAFRGWRSEGVGQFGGRRFAAYANVHQGCFLLTKDQMRYAIDSGGFGDEPHEIGCYGVRECCASDVYLQCGLNKVLCISDFADCRIEHLAPRGFSRYLISHVHMQLEIGELLEVEGDTGRRASP